MYQDESFYSNGNDRSADGLNQDARTLVNVTIGWSDDTNTIALFARNVFDEEYIEAGGRNDVVLGDPRQIGIRLQREF